MNGNKIALDTNQAIAWLNGDLNVRDRLLGCSRMVLPIIVLGELKYGAFKSNHPAKNLARIDVLISDCDVLGVGEFTATTYGQLRVALHKLGRPIPENDLWIAAICVEHGVPLLTADRHFQHVHNLNLVTV